MSDRTATLLARRERYETFISRVVAAQGEARAAWLLIHDQPFLEDMKIAVERARGRLREAEKAAAIELHDVNTELDGLAVVSPGAAPGEPWFGEALVELHTALARLQQHGFRGRINLPGGRFDVSG